MELMLTAVWRDMVKAPRNRCEPARLALVLAWDRRESEPLAWARAWRAALAVVPV
jgi:hypothetical protein